MVTASNLNAMVSMCLVMDRPGWEKSPTNRILNDRRMKRQMFNFTHKAENVFILSFWRSFRTFDIASDHRWKNNSNTKKMVFDFDFVLNMFIFSFVLRFGSLQFGLIWFSWWTLAMHRLIYSVIGSYIIVDIFFSLSCCIYQTAFEIVIDRPSNV